MGEFEDQLNALGVKLFHDVTDITEDEIKKATPVKHGRLRGSIHQEIIQDQPPVAMEAHIGTDVFYAVFLEWGTSRMAARGFMRKGVDNARRRIAKETAVPIRAFLSDVVELLK